MTSRDAEKPRGSATPLPGKCGRKVRGIPKGEPPRFCTRPGTGPTKDGPCRHHGGAAPQVVAKAAQRTLEAKISGEVRKLGWEPVTDPIAEYADTAGEILAFRDLAREQINELAGWSTQSVLTGVEQARAVIEVYERSLDRAEKTLGRMLQHNLDAAAIAAALRMRAERPSMEQAAWALSFARECLAAAGVTGSEADRAVAMVASKGMRE